MKTIYQYVSSTQHRAHECLLTDEANGSEKYSLRKLASLNSSYRWKAKQKFPQGAEPHSPPPPRSPEQAYRSLTTPWSQLRLTHAVLGAGIARTFSSLQRPHGLKSAQ